MDKHPLNILVVGCGGIAEAHLPAFLRFPGEMSVVALADPQERGRKALAERLGLNDAEVGFAGPEEALDAMGEGIDAVLVLTPHHLHFPAALAAVKAGKHVLVEKPVTTRLADAQDLLAAADKKGVTVMAGQTRRFRPESHALKQWIQSDPRNFGTLRTFEMQGWQNIEAWIASKPDKNADFWILDKERAGGGVVVSLLIHYIDLIRFLFETDFHEVSARGRFDPPFKNGAESSATALLTTVDGATGTLHGNYLARRTPWNESFKAFGEYGVLGNHPDAFGEYDGPVFHGSSHGREPVKWEDQYSDIVPLPRDDDSGLDSNPFVNQLREFVSAIREEREPESSLRINMNTLATIEALYASMANKGRAVEVPR